MALPNGLPLNSDLGSLLSTLGNDLVSIPLIAAPNTTIQNRAQMFDLSKDLGTRMSTNRIQTQDLYILQNEVGPSGEPVWGVMNDIYNQIRCVGNWNGGFIAGGQDGQGLSASTVNDFIEITFYGTGLNLLTTRVQTAGTTWNVSVDGGSISPVIAYSSSVSSVLTGRNYTANIVIPITSGLTVGLHTVRIICPNGTTGVILASGFEILNSSSNVIVNPGTIWKNGQKLYNAAQSSVAYNSGFESGALGSRGGRVVQYVKSDNTIAKAVNPTGSQLNLTAADHSNEEVARTYHWREFGAGRSNDDFSVFTGTPTAERSFTLDDGTTTLVAKNMAQQFVNNIEVFYTPLTTDHFTFIFVGTGLDIVRHESNTGSIDPYAVTIDGVSIGSLDTTAVAGRTSIKKVVSGLPYGTHTARFQRTSVSSGPGYSKFIVYQPKTPAIPAGAVKISSYNIMADYSGSTITGAALIDNLQMPVGCLYKAPSREFIYTGATQQFFPLDSNSLPGLTTTTLTSNGQPFSYSFSGTGFVLHMGGTNAGTYDYTVTIDGVLNATGVARSNSTNLGSGSYRSTSSTAYFPTRVEFTGLSMGKHTVTVTRTAGTGNFTFQGLHVITPIHSYKNNGPFVMQNTLSIGSQGIQDDRLLVSQVKSKNTSQALGVTQNPTTALIPFAPTPELSVMHNSKTGKVKISWSALMDQSIGTAATMGTFIYVNGVPVGSVRGATFATLAFYQTLSDTITLNVGVGQHKIDLYWNTNNGTMRSVGINRNLTVDDVD